MATKLDLKKDLKYLYAPSAKAVEVVQVPKLNFVMTDGTIQPGEMPEASTAFGEAMMALYGLSYTLKFMSKLRKEDPVDYTVMAVEGLWWVESGEFDFKTQQAWYWTMMMMQPEHITPEMYAEAFAQLKKKKDSPGLDRVRFEPFEEGLSIQIMHVGPYADEPKTLEKMKAFAQENSFRYRGKHHEIYLGDPRRAKPEKLRTVLRRAVERV